MNQEDIDDIEDVIETEYDDEVIRFGDLAVASFSIALIIVLILTSYYYSTDEEIPVYVCPEIREMDAPVALTRINDVNDYQAEVYLRGFIRQFIRSIYPKNSAEAKTFYKFASRHSTGHLNALYAGYDRESVAIGKELDDGKTIEFYPSRPTADPQSVRITRQSSSEWVVEIDGYLNNRVSAMADDRGNVTLRLTIVKDKASLKGSYSGLYVSDLEINHLADGMTNSKKKVE